MTRRRSMSERAYAALLFLLPRDFRREFSADMRDLFRDHLREARRGGALAVVALWLRTIPDLVITSIHEREDLMWHGITQDARYTLRALRKNPVFALVAVLVIALGTGAVSTIFSIANAIVLRPVPGVSRPSELVTIERTRADGGGSRSVSYPYYLALAKNAQSMRGIAAWDLITTTVSTGGEGVVAQSQIVTGNYFDVLGVRPAVGRFFAPDEDRVPNAKAVIVLSHEFWTRRFAADSAIVGKTILVNGRRFTVVGVAQQRFNGLFPVMRTDAWVPMMMQPAVRVGGDLLQSRGAGWLNLVGRLAPGADPRRAREELVGLTKRYAASEEAALGGDLTDFTGIRLSAAKGLPSDAVGPVIAFFVVLLAVSGLVLMIASVNVASMMLARAVARRRELAVRLALGVARARLVRQLLTESAILFTAGGALGSLIAVYGTRLVSRIPLPVDVALSVDIAPDYRVFAITLATAFVTGIAFGLAPALSMARTDVAEVLRGDGAPTGRASSRLRQTLVIAQVAASLLLLTTSGLFVRALARGHQVAPGYDVTHVATASIDVGLAGYDSVRSRAFYTTLRDRLRRIPDVTAVAYARLLPLSMNNMGYGIDVPGYTPPTQSKRGLVASANVVDPGYFAALRMPIIAGRGFTDADDQHARHVAVVSERFAATYWPGTSAIGRTFTLQTPEPVTVIGVVRDVKFAKLDERPEPFMYLPVAQNWRTDMSLLVRTSGDADALATPIRDAVHAIDPTLPAPATTTLERAASVVLLPQRFAVGVTAALGLLGLLLSAVGLYGLVAFTTAQRTREIGVRIAVGADRRDVVALVLRDGVRIVGYGIVVGLLVALVATRALAPFLFGVSPLDPGTYGVMAIVLGAVALVASIIPALRAASVDPTTALRHD